MKKKVFILIASAALMASSCKVVGTLYPVSLNPKDLVFKKELIGKWGDIKDSSGYYTVDTVAGENGKMYQLSTVFTNIEKNTTDTNMFRANLVLINGWYFLDCWVDLEKEFNPNDKSFEDWLIAKHFILRLQFQGTDKIALAAPDGDELIKLIDQKKISLNYATQKKDDYLILNKPSMLQKAITESNKYPLLYKESNVLNRLR